MNIRRKYRGGRQSLSVFYCYEGKKQVDHAVKSRMLGHFYYTLRLKGKDKKKFEPANLVSMKVF